MRNLFVVFLFMWLSPIAHATSCSLVIPETLPENSNTLKEFQKWIKTSKEFSYLSESEIKPFELDLNNDGKKELVLPLLQGSGGYLYIETFQKGASGFTSFGSPPPPVGVSSEGGWLTHACFRPKLPGSKTGSQYREVFFYQCGSDTYFTMSGDRLGECPVYIWKDKSVSRVCGDAIRERELDGAKAVYDLKDYPMSTNILNDYYQNCAKVMTDDQKLRFLSDLSLSYAKLKDQGECATTLKTATAIPSFKDSKFKSSITHNS
jgi:hypothetical protein